MQAEIKTVILFFCVLMPFAGAQLSQEIRRPPTLKGPLTPSRQEFKRSTIDHRLTCDADGEPLPTYKWFVNGTEVKVSQRYSINKGVLTIHGIDSGVMGKYHCTATTTFSDGQFAVAISPVQEIIVASIEDWDSSGTIKQTTALGSYYSIRCENVPKHVGSITFFWHYDNLQSGSNERVWKLVEEDSRVYVDEKGTIHFSHVTSKDGNKAYVCKAESVVDLSSKGGDQYELTVTAGSEQQVAPVLQFSTKESGPGALTFNRIGSGARLECFFSGNPSPTIQWLDNTGNILTNATGSRYDVRDYGHLLVITNLTEADEKQYTCRGSNVVSSSVEGTMTLNVTSAPIWINAGPKGTTTVEGRNAEFQCEARSAAGENPPNEPKWKKNGQPMEDGYDPTKYEFQNNHQRLVVKSVQKATDISCFQCSISNSEGELFGDACLTVILQLKIIVKPEVLDQTVKRGDIVNLTVVASSDPDLPAIYTWYFNGVTYADPTAPPHVFYDVKSRLAYINTSSLSDEQMHNISGTYLRMVHTRYENYNVSVVVRLHDEPVVEHVEESGFAAWIIYLLIVIGILLIIIIIVIICCVICRRKQLEGEYPVDRKETAAGLDPKKELKDSEFHDLSRADSFSYPQKKSTPLLGERESSGGSGQYGEDTAAFNEDGSFIGVYQKDEAPMLPPRKSASESNV